MVTRSAALIIGVGDYSRYSSAAGLPTGANDLPAPPNDVVLWYLAARAVGIADADIVVLASPPIARSALPGATEALRIGDGRRSSILGELGVLADKVDGDEPAVGLLTWSGHGALRADGACICPADTEPDLVQAIGYSELSALLSARAPRTNITAFFDTCHAGGAGGLDERLLGGARRGLGGALLDPSLARVPRLRPRDQVLAACKLYEEATEYPFLGRWHGVFTWVTSIAFQRWGLLEDEHGRSFNLSYGRLIEVATGLLRELSFSQTPVFEGEAGTEALPILHPRVAGAAGECGAPANEGRAAEIDPGESLGFRVYTINSLSNNTQIGQVVSVGSAYAPSGGSPAYAPSREYWYWSNNSPFPSAGFKITVAPPGTQPPNPGSAWKVCPNVAFTSSVQSQVYTASGKPYVIKTSDTTIVGWMNVATTSLTWWLDNTGSTVPPFYPVGGQGQPATMTFTAISNPPNQTAYPVVTDLFL